MNIVRGFKIKFNTWFFITLALVVIIGLPFNNLIKVIFIPTNDNWIHIKEYLLRDYFFNSIYLLVFTGLLSGVIGSVSAWIMVAYEFPLKNIFKWAVILPLTIPPYIGAYTYNNMLSYTGVIQRFFRNDLDLKVNPHLFDIMNLNGGVFVFTIFLFPYVYVITKAFLEKQSSSYVEVSRIYGKTGFEIFKDVILPLSKTAILSGIVIVGLEVLSDYGVVKYFGIPTFSVAIFKAWFGMSDVDSATRLAVVFLLIIISIVVIEKIFTNTKKISIISTKHKSVKPMKMKKTSGIITVCILSVIFLLSFLIPFMQIISWSILTYKNVLNFEFFKLIFNSVSVAIISSTIIIGVAVIIANQCRVEGKFMSKVFSKITTLGYSIPGAVVAITVLSAMIFLDKLFLEIYKNIFGLSGKLIITSSLVTLIFAYVIRYLAIGFNTFEAGFNKIGTKYFEASRTLGMGMTKTFFKVDLPLIKSVLYSAFILIFIDISKELPLTLILRPFNFDTLASKTYEYANDEMIQEAAIPSILIILISSIGVYILNKLSERKSKNVY